MTVLRTQNCMTAAQLLLALTCSASLYAAPFTAGNLAALRVGDGATALSNACTAVFIDEFTPSGTLVQSIALPSVGSTALCLSGTANSEGYMTRATDGSQLVIAGYQSTLGTASIASAAGVPRVVATIGVDGIVTLSAPYSDGHVTNNVRAAVFANGFTYTSGNGSAASGGVRLLDGPGTTTQISTTVTNTRALGAFDNQLYVSAQSGTIRIGIVGSGLPSASGQAITNLPGFATTTTSPYQFFLQNLDAAAVDVDTLWVANDDAAAIQKHSLVAGNWVSNGSVGTAADTYRGLTKIGGTLFVSNPSSIRTLAAGAYNTTLTGTPTSIVTAATNTAFRGLAPTPQGPPALTIANVSVSEGNSGSTTMTFTATLSSPALFDCNVRVDAFSDNTSIPPDNATGASAAGAGVDYLTIDQPLTIAQGQTSATYTVTVLGDTVTESNETFTTTAFGEPFEACLLDANSRAKGTIVDDDAAVSISIAAASVTEGNSGTTILSLPVTLASNASSALSIPFSVTGVSASNPADFTTVSGTVSIAAGAATGAATVVVVGDALDENDETLTVTLGTLPAGLQLGTGTATGTIVDDDGAPTLSVNAPIVVEGNSGSVTMNFVVSLSSASGQAVNFTSATQDGSATAGSDYVGLAAISAVIPAGQTSVTIPVQISGDTAVETDETLQLQISGISNAIPVSVSGTGTIRNDDSPVTTIPSLSAHGLLFLLVLLTTLGGLSARRGARI